MSIRLIKQEKKIIPHEYLMKHFTSFLEYCYQSIRKLKTPFQILLYILNKGIFFMHHCTLFLDSYIDHIVLKFNLNRKLITQQKSQFGQSLFIDGNVSNIFGIVLYMIYRHLLVHWNIIWWKICNVIWIHVLYFFPILHWSLRRTSLKF